MGLFGKLQVDVAIKSPATKFHEMISARPQDLSMASNDNIQGCKLCEGEFGKVGSIVLWSYVHDGKLKVAKDRVEHIDNAKKTITYKVIDGDLLNDYKSFKITVKVVPKDEGNVVQWILEYEKLNEKVANPETLLDFFAQISKDMDCHLSAQAQA